MSVVVTLPAASPAMPMPVLAPQPNDLDCRRIERAIEKRQRYRYVEPNVVKVTDGYRIESPCCSRNVDAEGGTVDVALLLYLEDGSVWHLYRKDHDRQAWEFHSRHKRLNELLDLLNADTERLFWQ